MKTGERLTIWAKNKKGIGFLFLYGGAMDTTITAFDELVFAAFAFPAQFERRRIPKCTLAGLTSARAQGQLGGRKKIGPTSPKVFMAKNLPQN